MITRTFWVCFNLETGDVEGIFRNERDATWYCMAFYQHLSVPRPYEITYDMTPILQPINKENEDETT